MVGFVILLKEVPASEYALLGCCLIAVFIYRALHFHFIEDLLTAFRGHRLRLVYNSTSPLASQLLPQCHILHQRYSPTPWLSSPHVQTAFLHFFGRAPQLEYNRKLHQTPDGGTIALDWLSPNIGSKARIAVNDSDHECLKETCIAIVIPGLTSDSADAYVKHIAYSLATSGWRVVVANHRGLGGVPITSNQFYNAGWTEDLRMIINHVRQANPKIPIFAVGTSIGANILVKYLGEEGDRTPLGGAAAICCPWDLLVCDRFICREWIQRLYDKILALGLCGYAAVHQVVLSQLADWELISKCRSVREFDHHCTCVVGKFETVDTYYRKNSCAVYLPSVSIPLLCISALDDPVCTKEAIPWDECRINGNVLLGIARHGGHLAFFEGLTAHSIWWVRATTEFLKVLSASSLVHVPHQAQVTSSGSSLFLENTMDLSYLNIPESEVIAKARPMEDDDNLVQFPAVEDGQMYTLRSCRDLQAVENGERNSPLPGKDKVDGNGISVLGSGSSAETYSQASSSACSERSADFHHSTLKVSVQNYSQLLILESTLSDLLEQVHLRKRVIHKVGKGSDESSAVPSEVNTGSKEVWIHSHAPESAETDHSPSSGKKPLASFYKRNSSGAHVNRNSEVPFLQGMKAVARQNRHSLWLLAYIAIVTTWPLIGSAMLIRCKTRFRHIFSKFASKPNI